MLIHRVFRRSLILALLLALPLFAQEVADTTPAHDHGAAIRASGSATAPGLTTAPAADAQAAAPELFPLPRGGTPRLVVVTAGTYTAINQPAGPVAGAGERLVYSNTLGEFAIQLRADQLVADDASLNAPSGCNLRRYSVDVSLKVDPAGIGGPVTARLRLFDTCPQADGVPIPGTDATISFTAEDVEANPLVTIVVQAPPGVDVPLTGTVWPAVRFDRDNAGVVMGAPALVGFSSDVFDYPLLNCNADIGGFPNFPHASFNAEVYVEDTCPRAFLGYRNIAPGGSARNEGGGIRFADDLELQVDSCDLIGYEVGVSGRAAYWVDLRYDRDGLPGDVIVGTPRALVTSRSGEEVLYVPVDPPVPLAGSPNRLWVTLRPNLATGKWIRTERNAQIGQTAASVAVGYPPGVWTITFPQDEAYGAFYATIHCAGDPPTGACCDMYLLDEDRDAVCREVPRMNCPFPPRGSTLKPDWMEGAVCDPDPFPRPCGVAACCTPEDTCENLTRRECFAIEPVERARYWRPGLYCDEDGQECPFSACLERQGSCTTPGETLGCEYPDCCTYVCEADAYCCREEWDRACVELADLLCDLQPENDECAPISRLSGATWVDVPGSAISPASHATTSDSDPGFCCHSGIDPVCSGGTLDDFPCLGEADCPEGSCPPRNAQPGNKGYGTTWFKFIANNATAELSTAYSNSPVTDTLVQVFAVGDPTDDETACNSLTPIACFDDTDAKSWYGVDLPNSTFCVRDLVPGQLYYVEVAAKTAGDQGLYHLNIDAPCATELRVLNNDCSNAQPMAPGRVPIDFAYASADCPIEACGNIVRRDLWFDYTAEETGIQTLGACGLRIADRDVVVAAVYEGCECPPSEESLVFCDTIGDDACRADNGHPFPVEAGQCYKIRLGLLTPEDIQGEFCIDCRYCPTFGPKFLAPAGPVLAGRPYDPADPAALEGVDAIPVEVFYAAPDPACWSLCETHVNEHLHPPYSPDLAQNAITSVEGEDKGWVIPQRINLKRPLTPGEVTVLAYTSNTPITHTATYTAHPGDVNGDGVTDGNDMLDLAEYVAHRCHDEGCDGLRLTLYQADIDNDGRVNALDLLELVDLLVGAGAYEPWLGSTIPPDQFDCP